MRTRRRVDPILLREIERLQELSQGIALKARRKVKALGLKALLLDLMARNGRFTSDPWEAWARLYRAVTDNMLMAWDILHQAAH